MNIVLIARQSYANSITEGKEYIPLCQTKTGFLINGDDDVEIDLYIHFFRVGCTNGKETHLLAEKSKVVKTETVEEPVKPKTTIKEKEVVVETKKEDSVPVAEEVNKVESKTDLSHLIDEDDDF